MDKQATQALGITVVAMRCAMELESFLRLRTDKMWTVTIRKAEYLDFQLLATLTHWQIMTPFGDHTTTSTDLRMWLNGIESQWRRDMQEMA